MGSMDAFELDLPDFDEAPWDAKGYFTASLTCRGRTYVINFYDPVRLHQEASEAVARGGVFFEPNLVMVEHITRANLEAAVGELVSTGQLKHLVSED